MKISTQLAIIEDFSRVPPRAMTRRDLSEYLAAKRSSWAAPQSLGVDALINLLIENDSLKVAEISSDSYGRKVRYLVGKVSFLQLASSRGLSEGSIQNQAQKFRLPPPTISDVSGERAMQQRREQG